VGRPVKSIAPGGHAIFYVAATGASGEPFPALPNWNPPSLSPRVVAQRHLGAHRGTSRRRCREQEGREGEPPRDRRCPLGAVVLDGEARTKGISTRKDINGRKTFGIATPSVLLVAVVVVAASSPTTSWDRRTDRRRARSGRFAKPVVRRRLQGHLHRGLPRSYVGGKVVTRPPASTEVLRSVGCRAHWSWLMNSRDCRSTNERDPVARKAFIWAAPVATSAPVTRHRSPDALGNNRDSHYGQRLGLGQQVLYSRGAGSRRRARRSRCDHEVIGGAIFCPARPPLVCRRSGRRRNR